MDVPSWMAKPVAHHPWSGVLTPVDTEVVGQFAATFHYMKVMPFGGLLLIPRFTDGAGPITVYDIMIHSNEGILSACLTEDTRWFHHRPNDILHYQRLKEVCSGLGGIAIAAHRAGIHAVAHLDHNGLACAQLRANAATNVIHGSICETTNIAKLHAAGGPQPAACGPARRDRWWAILAPLSFNLEVSYPGPTHYIPRWPHWLPTEREMDFYTNPIYGDEPRLLQVSAPPCGCRQKHFCAKRLVQQGLRGFYVRSLIHNAPRFLTQRRLDKLQHHYRHYESHLTLHGHRSLPFPASRSVTH